MGEWKRGLVPGVIIGAFLTLFVFLKSPAFPDYSLLDWVGVYAATMLAPVAITTASCAVGLHRLPKTKADRWALPVFLVLAAIVAVFLYLRGSSAY